MAYVWIKYLHLFTVTLSIVLFVLRFFGNGRVLL